MNEQANFIQVSPFHISSLIQALSQVLDEHGDLPVMSRDEMEEWCPVDIVQFIRNDDGKVVAVGVI